MKKLDRLRLSGLLGLALLTVVLALSCGEKSSPTDPAADNPETPQPNPDGVQLEGGATDNGIDALVTLPPSPADSADMAGRLFRTRLAGVISPSATVGEINSVLVEHGVRIICMMPGVPFVTLKTPPLTNEVSVDSLAAILTATPAFLSVTAAYEAGMDFAPRGAVPPGEPASQNISHLEAMRMPAAWNVKGLVTSGQKTRVMVADQYAELTASSEISAQTFVTGGTTRTAVEGGINPGNHGFHVCGILGANFDQVGATGACPDGQDHLAILSLPVGGWTLFDIQAGLVFNISQKLPVGQFLLNTSLGYTDPTFSMFDRYNRALNMMAWRMLVDGAKDRFLHFTSAGNDGRTAGEGGESQWNSPFASSARFDNMQQMVEGEALSADQQATIDAVTALAQQAVPGALTPLQNVIIVGAVNSSGQEAIFSSSDPDVFAVGTVVYGPCAEQDPDYSQMIPVLCDGQVAQYDGTSQATPQIAALAAYLLNLQTSLTLSEVKDIILRSKTARQEDAYMAVLSLDKTLNGAAIRKRLLDVATATGEGSDGSFDENDLLYFKQQFQLYDTERTNSGSNDIDNSRCDLNGDGMTGGNTPSFFDLDINNPPVFALSVSQDLDGFARTFNENEVTDQEILCYYAWSSLYTGSTSERASILDECAPPWVLEVQFPVTLNPSIGEAGTVTVSRGLGESLVPQLGVQITLISTGGIASPATGQTGPNGQFSTMLDLDDASPEMSIHVVAEYGGHEIGDQTVVVSAAASNTGRMSLTRRTSKTRSYACSNYGSDCNANELLDTSTSPGVSFASRSHQDNGSWNGFAGSASNTCTRRDSVTLASDSSLLTFNYLVTSSSASSATSPSIDSGAMNASGNGVVELEYLFRVSDESVNLAANLLYDYTDSGSDECCRLSSYGYALQVYRVGLSQPIVSFSFFGPPTPFVTNSVLSEVLLTGDYQMKVYLYGGSASNIEGGTVSLSTEMSAAGTITIGTSPAAIEL